MMFKFIHRYFGRKNGKSRKAVIQNGTLDYAVSHGFNPNALLRQFDAQEKHTGEPIVFRQYSPLQRKEVNHD